MRGDIDADKGAIDLRRRQPKPTIPKRKALKPEVFCLYCIAGEVRAVCMKELSDLRDDHVRYLNPTPYKVLLPQIAKPPQITPYSEW
jgi:hypothetical protein